jgi:ATP-dependent helicase/nuclease subunit A
MKSKLFSIYRSSAGSGKTRTLSKEYLLLAMRFGGDYYKHILAVTFTNKATQEMKTRILGYLNAFSEGVQDSLAQEIMLELNMDSSSFQERAKRLRSEILHTYSQFSISTIDSFFQKVIRSFTREAGLSGDYTLEIDHNLVAEEVIDKLVTELGTNEQLTRWLIEYAKANLENDKPWDVRGSLHDFSKEIFREEFRAIEDDLLRTSASADYFKKTQTTLRKSRHEFITTITGIAQQAIADIHKEHWTKEDFKYGGGVYSFFVKFSKVSSVKDVGEGSIGSRPRKEYLDSTNWPSANSPYKAAIQAAAEKELINKLHAILDYRDRFFKEAISAEVVLNNFYAFGLVADLSRKMREHKEEHNMMLLADAPKFLNGIIQGSDTPFIYEKVGSFYRNYLIDEFQDTSGMQWNNFKPLLVNSLDQGYPCFVVGDVKQSIYRWRGGDLQLLQHNVEQHIGTDRVAVKKLSSNFRSAINVVNFNNAFFEAASKALANEIGTTLVADSYSDAAQQIYKNEKGIVRIDFIKQVEEQTSWKEEALQKVASQLEVFQDQGIALRDVAILVRNNREGVDVAEFLLSCNKIQSTSKYRYDVISNESLRLDGALSVSILISALQFMVNPENLIARAQLSYDYSRLSKTQSNFHSVFSVSDKELFKKKLPIAFVKEIGKLKKLPLFEITETLISVFELNETEGELTYLQNFQNLVLEFYSRERNDVQAFLEWWEKNKSSKSLKISGEVNAVQIYTIHKSKGLQFKYVIIPFCSWELDHSPQKSPHLWVTTNEKPFEQETCVPVKYSGVLKDTIFSEAYSTERVRVYLDNLNLLYVAFTRAENGLIVYAPHPENSRVKQTVASMLFSSLSQSPTLAENWNEVLGSWHKGEYASSAISETNNLQGVISLNKYEVNRWRNRMVFRKQIDNFFQHQQLTENVNKKYGVFLHSILARIHYQKDVESVLNSVRDEGLLSADEIEMVSKQLMQLFSNEQICYWFHDSWQVSTEIPILIPGSSNVRVDRILIKGDCAVVIDYKSGEVRPRDEEQVANYMQLLHEMNFSKVEGYLIYLASSTVEAVPRKTNSKQLGLGI